MRNQPRLIIYLVVLAVFAALAWMATTSQKTEIKETTITEVTGAVSQGTVESIEVDGNKVTAKLKNGTQLITFKENGVGLHEYGLTSDKVKIDIKNPDRGSLTANLFSLLPILLIGLLLWLMFRSAQGANVRALQFGKSSARMAGPYGKKTTFADIAGLKEAKFELEEVVQFLKQPEKFRAVGAEIPKGVLLVGPPGTGKTLMAKAVAGEAGVPFFSISASEFVEMFVGVGAARVRDLFLKAKKNAPAVIFIDELDAIGRQRGTGLGGSHDEREQTLNQILVEMDGFETDTRVIIMAATNRPDVLDPALLRPGRFDRRVVIDLPDKIERAAILQIHAKNKPLGEDVNLTQVASNTAGFSGADLKNLMNEAAILTGRDNRKKITKTDLDQAIEKVLLGPERRSRILSDEEKKITAYHEGGHALVGHILEHADPIHKVSIVSRGTALGYTWSRPEADRFLTRKSKFEDDIAQLLGGRVAEELVFGEISTGAHNDLAKATKLARNMVTVYGMSETLGPVVLGEREEVVFLGRELGERRNYSEEIAAKIDAEVAKIIAAGRQRATEVLKKNRKILDTLAEKLLAQETLDGEEFAALFA
jgi:cell division protease FtsH